MKIVALIKTFSGHEFATSSLDSIYDFCEKIIYVHSNKSWSGKEGNTVYSIVENWKKEYDKKDKIINLYGDWTNQDSQYDYGFQFIKKNLESDFIMLVDTDEIWDKQNLDLSRMYLTNHKNINAFSCNMHTYIKNPLWKVQPCEPCKPIIFIRNSVNNMLGVRGNGINPKLYMNNVYMHHFCYVRETENEIKDKFINSEIGDKNVSNDYNDWKINKWDKLPNVFDFHPTKGAETCWHSIKIINKNELPITVQNNKILEKWSIK
jgi:hypothetical protein